jgi:hypothetical protein
MTTDAKVLSAKDISDMAAQLDDSCPYYLPSLLASHERLRALLADCVDSLKNDHCGDPNYECPLQDAGKSYHCLQIAKLALEAK